MQQNNVDFKSKHKALVYTEWTSFFKPQLKSNIFHQIVISQKIDFFISMCKPVVLWKNKINRNTVHPVNYAYDSTLSSHSNDFLYRAIFYAMSIHSMLTLVNWSREYPLFMHFLTGIHYCLLITHHTRTWNIDLHCGTNCERTWSRCYSTCARI